MRAAIITIAGISARFNAGIPEDEKILKAIYNGGSAENTLLFHLLKKCSYADCIVIVGGYKYDAMRSFFDKHFADRFPQTVFVQNDHYEDLASGYSLYLGVVEALQKGATEILLVEGDLDIDDGSFERVRDAELSVLTYTTEPIYANKAVVLYRDAEDHYKYAFNSEHGCLMINEPFSCILNSGQTWKFTDMEALRDSNDEFVKRNPDGTNLAIIQGYIDRVDAGEIELVRLDRWVNCNTREDYREILNRWRGEE